MARRTEFTAEEKYKAAQRELEWRLRVYPGRIAKDLMSRREAEYQIDVMRAIARDYNKLAQETERLI
jgi:antibiotic biosynthesis monooxygenase (ABM) superfamily enzyme